MMTPVLSANLTSHELQLGVPIGVILAAAFALTGVILTLRNSRRLAQDERLWTARTKVYGKVLRDMEEVNQALPGLAPGPVKPPLTEAEVVRNEARLQNPFIQRDTQIRLFATPRLQRQLTAINFTTAQLVYFVAHQEQDAEWIELRELLLSRVREQVEEARKTMRLDLYADAEPRRRQRNTLRYAQRLWRRLDGRRTT